jgi:hypothetical protein
VEAENPFEVPLLKVEWAKTQIQDLESRIKAFADSKPYKRVSQNHPKARNLIFQKIRFVKPVPRVIEIVIGQIVNCLREALDNAGYGIAVVSGKVKPLKCHFPFANDREALKNALGNFKDIPQEILALFCKFKPYKGGNDLLWALNRMCVAHKHKIGLAPVGLGIINVQDIRVTGGTVGLPCV